MIYIFLTYIYGLMVFVCRSYLLYSEEIKEKVFNFYINDFNFFDENGICYIKSPVEM